MEKLRFREGIGHSIPTGPDSETPSKLEAETCKGLTTPKEETELGRKLGWSPAIPRDP